MYILRKILNKYNGNLCFSAESDSDYYIFECDRSGQSVSYDIASKRITGICSYALQTYLVCFGDTAIGSFNGTTLNESYSSVTLPVTVDLMTGNTEDNNLYIWSKAENALHRIEIVGGVTSIVWTYYLPYDFTDCIDAKLFYKKTSDLVIFKGLNKIISVRDLNSSAATVGMSTIENNSWVTSSGDSYPSITYARTRQVWGKDLENTSSSSSSNSSSSSSTSESSSSSTSSESVGNTTSSSSSSSESSGGYDVNYCVSGHSNPLVNGTYTKNGMYWNDKPIFYNGNRYLYYQYYTGYGISWVVADVIEDDYISVDDFQNEYGLYFPDEGTWYYSTVTSGTC